MKLPPLRPFQKEALARFQRVDHLLVLAPTGSGKSRIIYDSLQQGLSKAVLISPLVALNQQHASTLRGLGRKVWVGRSEAPRERKESGFWILSPESVSEELFHDWKPDLLAVDEAHMVWEWGARFRPSFQKLLALAGASQIPKSMWLTATLESTLREEWLQWMPRNAEVFGQFGLPPRVLVSARKVPWPIRMQVLRDWISSEEGAGIVFVATRREAERLSRYLNSCFGSTSYYHAGLAIEERRALERRFALGEIQRLVSTSAFGLGMDVGHLDWVVLWQAPSSLSMLAQQLGRVGRSERSGKTAVFWDEEDFELIPGDRSSTRAVREFLSSLECRKEVLKAYFEGGKVDPQASCGSCDNCNWKKNLRS